MMAVNRLQRLQQVHDYLGQSEPVPMMFVGGSPGSPITSAAIGAGYESRISSTRTSGEVIDGTYRVIYRILEDEIHILTVRHVPWPSRLGLISAEAGGGPPRPRTSFAGALALPTRLHFSNKTRKMRDSPAAPAGGHDTRALATAMVSIRLTRAGVRSAPLPHHRDRQPQSARWPLYRAARLLNPIAMGKDRADAPRFSVARNIGWGQGAQPSEPRCRAHQALAQESGGLSRKPIRGARAMEERDNRRVTTGRVAGLHGIRALAQGAFLLPGRPRTSWRMRSGNWCLPADAGCWRSRREEPRSRACWRSSKT